MARKYIKRVSKVKNDDTKGYIINSTNVVDKEKNTYSAEIIDGLVKDVYSTTEQVIGTWIDGKPLYRKVVVYEGTALGTHATINHNISDIGDYRMIEKQSFIVGGGRFFGYANSTSYAEATGFTETYLDIYIGNDWANLFTKAVFVLEYTKTTD